MKKIALFLGVAFLLAGCCGKCGCGGCCGNGCCGCDGFCIYGKKDLNNKKSS